MNEIFIHLIKICLGGFALFLLMKLVCFILDGIEIFLQLGFTMTQIIFTIFGIGCLGGVAYYVGGLLMR